MNVEIFTIARSYSIHKSRIAFSQLNDAGISLIVADSFPFKAGISICILLNAYTLADQKTSLKIIISDEDGNLIENGYEERTLEFPEMSKGDSIRLAFNITFTSLIFPSAGLYTIDLSINGEHKTGILLRVKLTE